MNEGIPRPLLVLAAIVVLVAVFVGVKDYFQKPKETQTTASASPAVAPSNASTAPEKTGAAKLKRASISGLRNTGKARHYTQDGIEQSSINKDSWNGDSEAALSNDEAFPVGAEAARDGADAVADLRVSQGDKANAKIVRLLLSAPQCVPLPNSVLRGDVDAPYYENWAREYSCKLR